MVHPNKHPSADKLLSLELAKLLGCEVGAEIPSSQVTGVVFGAEEKDFILDQTLIPVFGLHPVQKNIFRLRIPLGVWIQRTPCLVSYK